MARYKAGVFVALVALVLGIGARTAAIAQNDQATPASGFGVPLIPIGSNTQTDLENAEATIAALQTTVAEQATTIAGQATTIAGLTGEPTPTPTAGTRTPQPPDDPVDLGDGIVLSSYLFVDTDYGLYLAADLVNASGSPIMTPSVDARFYDEDGNLLGETSLRSRLYWADVDWHIPYTQSSILGGAYDLSEIARVEISASPNPYNVYEEVDSSNMSIVGAPVEGPDGEINARVQNNRTAPVGPLSIVYAVYDAQGTIVGACDSFLDIMIPPGKSAEFNASGQCFEVEGAADQAIGGKPFTYRMFVVLF